MNGSPHDVAGRRAGARSPSAQPSRHWSVRLAEPHDEPGIVDLRRESGWSISTVPQQFRAMASGRRSLWVAEVSLPGASERHLEVHRVWAPSAGGRVDGVLRTAQVPAPGSPTDRRRLVVGTITLEWEHDDPELADGYSRAHISNLVVHPQYRRRGIGHALIDAAEREAARAGRTVITIGVDEPNTYARRLYERLGYGWFKNTTATWGRIHLLRRSLLSSQPNETAAG